MSELHWNWLCAPYIACAITLLAVTLVAALLRGDRVMRLGVIGAATTTLPWAICSALTACVDDASTATRLLRVGSGPVALIGPNLMLVLLGVSGQLERNRWVARIAGVVGVVMLALCWGTNLVIPGVQRLPVGLYYTTAGPLTDLHWSQLVLWMAVGMWISRRAATSGEKQRISRLLIGVLALGALGSVDLGIIHRLWSFYPIAWLPATLGAMIALYLVLYTDLLRPQGVDRLVIGETLVFAGAAIVVGLLVFAMDDAAPLAKAVVASVVWLVALGATWAVAGARPVPIADSRPLEQFVAALADVDDEKKVVAALGRLWKPIPIAIKRAWRVEGGELVDVASGETWALDKQAAAWLVEQGQAIAPTDLATMRLGAQRPVLEALLEAHGATLVVPLVDRGALVGLVEGDHGAALREDERGLVAEAARAAARALTYASLARTAAKERATAREVELAEAMRLQASASRDDELGRWTVAAEYRAASKATGAGWSAQLLADGRLALMVTEAQANGVAAALATATLTGAFAAATTGVEEVGLHDLLASLRASAEGLMQGKHPVAAFIAVLDADRQSLEWACAGHPGAYAVGPVAYDLAQFPTGSTTGPRPKAVPLGGDEAAGASLQMATRGQTRLPHDSLLVIASTAVRGEDEERWQSTLREQAPAGPRLAVVLVEAAQKRGDLSEDFLAVVVRQRPDRSSKPVIAIPR